MDPDKQRYARDTDARTLAEIVEGADVFLGLSAGGVLKPEMVAAMAAKPIILALANPTPEIMPEVAQARCARTASSPPAARTIPNQVNNALCFPYIFRGALDVGATDDQRGDEARLRARDRRAGAAWRLAISPRAYGGEAPHLRPRLPDPAPFDPRLLVHAGAGGGAGGDGFRRRHAADRRHGRLPRKARASSSIRTGLLMKPVFERARADRKRVVYAEGEEETVLRAVQTVIDEKLARPILIGRPDVIERAHRARSACACEPGVDFELTNINDDPRFNEYWQQYHALTERRGVSPAAAKNLLRSRPTADRRADGRARRGRCDDLRPGRPLPQEARLHPRSVFGLDPGACSAPSAMTGVINDKGAWFFLDTHVQVDPDRRADRRGDAAGLAAG